MRRDPRIEEERNPAFAYRGKLIHQVQLKRKKKDFDKK